MLGLDCLGHRSGYRYQLLFERGTLASESYPLEVPFKCAFKRFHRYRFQKGLSLRIQFIHHMAGGKGGEAGDFDCTVRFLDLRADDLMKVCGIPRSP